MLPLLIFLLEKHQQNVMWNIWWILHLPSKVGFYFFAHKVSSFFVSHSPPPFLRRERTSWRILKVTFDTNLLGTYLGRNDSAATVSNDSGCIIGVPWLGSNSSGYTFWLIIYNQSIAYKQDSLLMFFWVDVCFSIRVVRTLKNWRYGWLKIQVRKSIPLPFGKKGWRMKMLQCFAVSVSHL